MKKEFNKELCILTPFVSIEGCERGNIYFCAMAFNIIMVACNPFDSWAFLSKTPSHISVVISLGIRESNPWNLKRLCVYIQGPERPSEVKITIDSWKYLVLKCGKRQWIMGSVADFDTNPARHWEDLKGSMGTSCTSSVLL